MDTWIHTAKLLGIACTTALGVLGLVTEYRDENKRITKWGRRALVGIVVSGTLTILVHVLEVARAELARDTEMARLAEEVHRQEQTLKGVETLFRQLDRDRKSLTGASISISFQFPEDSPYIRPHYEKMRDVYSRLIAEFEKSGHAHDPAHPDLYVYGASGGRSVDRILLFSRSKDFPDISLSMGVSVYPSEAALGDGDLQSPSVAPDLDFALYSGRAEKERLSYLPAERAYMYEFTEAPSFGEATGAVTSLSDLPGKTLALGLVDYVADGGKAMQQLALKDFSFVHPLGIRISLSREAITRTGREWPEYSFHGKIQDIRR